MREDKAHIRPDKLLIYGIIAIFVLMPFHALFTTWLASNFNHFDLFRIWKDLLLIPLGLGALWLIFKDSQRLKALKSNRLFYLISAYIFILLLLGIWARLSGRINTNAMLYGWLSDGRYLVFFLICFAVASATKFKQQWTRLLLIPATLVIVFGLLQYFLLPADFLRHFGYGEQTIQAYQAVDLKSGYVRLQSTLRGPNPLGAYLVLIITAVTGLLLTQKRLRIKWALLGTIAAFVLTFTYSRSAWVGAALAALCAVWLLMKNQKARTLLISTGLALLLLGGGVVVLLRHNDRVQNTFFHTDENSRSPESSNQTRIEALESGLNDLLHEPIGRGPGSSGPASVRNDHEPRISENYYLQIGQEVGWLGLLLFIAINIEVVYQLYLRRADVLSVVLLSSLVGITFINLLSHAWADDTLALIWWGLAGLALGAQQPAQRQSR